jgi:hypothetical protein
VLELKRVGWCSEGFSDALPFPEKKQKALVCGTISVDLRVN